MCCTFKHKINITPNNLQKHTRTAVLKRQIEQFSASTASSGVFTRGLVGVQTPPMTGPTKIFSITFITVYSVLCVIYAVS